MFESFFWNLTLYYFPSCTLRFCLYHLRYWGLFIKQRKFSTIQLGKISQAPISVKIALMKIFDLALQSQPVWMRLKLEDSLQSIALRENKDICRFRHKLICLASKHWKSQYYLCRVRHKLLRTKLLVLNVTSDSAELDRFRHKLFH